MRTITLLAILLFAVPAHAEKTIRGRQARTIVQALKLSGTPPAKVKEFKWTYSATSVECHSLAETDDGLPTFDCVVDGRQLNDARAYVLHDALYSAGLPSDSQMSQTHVRAFNLVCINDGDAHGGVDSAFRCSYRDELPFGIDAAMITAAMAPVRPRIMECGPQYLAHGVIRAAVAVNPDGQVRSATIVAMPAGQVDELGPCITSKLEHMTFPPTRNGGTFTMPFVF